MSLAEYYKGVKVNQLPEIHVKKKYGNQSGSYILLNDGSKLWVDPADGTCLWVIGK